MFTIFGDKMAATNISVDLILRVREFYTMAYQEITLDQRKQVTPTNGITDYAIPSYILAVAAVEAFMNEAFLAIGLGFLKDSSFAKLSTEERLQFQKANLGEKLIKLPALAFDQEVFNRGRQPFQDMNHLINVRDSFVHYKMGFEAEYQGAFEYLRKKGIALNAPSGPSNFWVSDLSTFEGIRWAHDTVLRIIKDIIDTAIKTNRHPILIAMGTQSKNFFQPMPDPYKENERWLGWLNFYSNWKKINKKEAG
jgi:hypothetical protein